jgi:hypothetical protein
VSVKVHATLYLEVRSRKSKRPFAPPEREHRVYTAEIDADPNDHSGLLTLVRQSEGFGAVYQSNTRFYPESYDPETRTGVYRESYPRSDRLVDELELYGWTRRKDLEGKP